MNLTNSLSELWHEHAINSKLPPFVEENKFCFSKNNKQSDILVLGLNPIFTSKLSNVPVRYDFKKLLKATFSEDLESIYFKNIRDFLKSPLIAENTTYTDLFYYRTKVQKAQLNQLLDNIDGIRFLEDQLKITQLLLEYTIQPRIIIATSWEVLLFLGLFKETSFSNWLNYDLQLINTTSTNHKVYEIMGMENTSSMNNLFLDKTNLTGTRIICYPQLSEQTKIEIMDRLDSKEVEKHYEHVRFRK